jgi:uncharacterized protein
MYIYLMEFEWDDEKNRKNIDKHGISFWEAIEIFMNPMFRKLDNRFRYAETRYILTGLTREEFLITLVCTLRGKNC